MIQVFTFKLIQFYHIYTSIAWIEILLSYFVRVKKQIYNVTILILTILIDCYFIFIVITETYI